MAWRILLTALAAWGLLTVLWSLLGWMILKKNSCIMLYLCKPGRHPDGALSYYRWLHGLGLIHDPLFLLDCRYSAKEQELLKKKYPGIEFCSLDALPSRLELERNRLD